MGTVAIPLSKLYDENPHLEWFPLLRGLKPEKKKLIRLQLHYTFSRGTNIGAQVTLQNNDEILEAIAHPDLDLFFALTECLDVADIAPVSSAMVAIFEYKKRAFGMLRDVIAREVANTSK